MNILSSCILFGLLLWSYVDTSSEGEENHLHCLDNKGKEIWHGERFFPIESEPCTQCTCLNGKPENCSAFFCSPPENCQKYHTITDRCCEFVCLDKDYPNKASDEENHLHCLDNKGKEVGHGERFFPLESEPCTQCTCLNGKSENCITVFCSPPENCKEYHTITDRCCEFVCLDKDYYPNKASDAVTPSTTNSGLRLVARTVTSFFNYLITLLLFMIHGM